MKVFGVGLSRTGGRSLIEALRQLGYVGAHWDVSSTLIEYARGGEFKIHCDRAEPYAALGDLPVGRIFRELDAFYPGSRFVLTTREESAWLDSMQRHIATLDTHGTWTPLSRALHEDVYGTTTFDAGLLAAARARHRQQVTEYFADRPDDLLVLDLCGSQGWDALCAFLGRPSPEGSFPWVRD